MLAAMSEAPVYIGSDAHLGAASPEMEAAFHRWLEFAGERAGLIFINGDLFDFWFEYGSVIPRGHTRTLGLLARIVDAGVPVHLMGGNHDWWGGRYLTDEVGVTFHRDPVRMTLAGHRCLVAHGDGLGRGDLGYRLLRLILRGRFTRFAFRWVHPDLGAAIARGVSRTETRLPDDHPRIVARSEALEGWARDTLLEDESLDAVFLGHTHLPRRVEVAPGRWYVNTGDWVRHGTWAVLEPGHPPRLETWDEAGAAAPGD
jgi:UDP-2,3-diacylglucosamine hydrolase